jgi:hypothetical protein
MHLMTIREVDGRRRLQVGASAIQDLSAVILLRPCTIQQGKDKFVEASYKITDTRMQIRLATPVKANGDD